MFVFAAILALAATASAQLPMHDGRIVGGKPTTIDKFPYQVSLERVAGAKHFCGGSILSKNYVVTAAHCVQGRDASYLQVRVNSTLREKDGKVYSVQSISGYPGFTMSKLDGDVAVLRLSQSITFGVGVGPIDLVPITSEPKQGDMLTVTGWGTLQSGDSFLPSILQVTRVPTIDRSLCRLSYGTSKITETMLCAGVSKKDACQGDSGGPLVNELRQLVGIVSWGKGCGYPGYPGIYASVANPTVRNFITQNIRME